jgi:hypothetical protein
MNIVYIEEVVGEVSYEAVMYEQFDHVSVSKFRSSYGSGRTRIQG